MITRFLFCLLLLGCPLTIPSNPVVPSPNSTAFIPQAIAYKQYNCYIRPPIFEIPQLSAPTFPLNNCTTAYSNFELNKNSFIRPIKTDVDFNWATDEVYNKNGQIALAFYLKADTKLDTQNGELTCYKTENKTIYLWQLEKTKDLNLIDKKEGRCQCSVIISKPGEYDVVDASFDPPKPIEKIKVKDDTFISTLVPGTAQSIHGNTIGSDYWYISPEQRAFYP
jgi:hypothetical protein